MSELGFPPIGCGTWTYDDEAAARNVLTAIEVGYRMIDTAAYYGNERGVGAAIAASGLPREDLFVTSKVWKTELGYEKARRSFFASLERLGLDYLDAFLIHWPAVESSDRRWKQHNAETWRALEALHREGYVRHIGVSNFTPKYLEALAETQEIGPEIDQIEFHPGFAQLDIVEYCAQKGIHCQAWSPFGRGDVFQNPDILRLSAKYGVSPARLCLAWIRAHGVTPIVKSANRERLRDNLNCGELLLEPDDVKAIDDIPFFGRLGYDPETVKLSSAPKIIKDAVRLLKK